MRLDKLKINSRCWNYNGELLFSYLISRHLHQLEDLTLDYSMVTETGLNYIAGNSSNSNAKNSKLRRLSLQGRIFKSSVVSFTTLNLNPRALKSVEVKG